MAKTKAKSKATPMQGAKSSSSKRARLGTLPGSVVLPPSLVQKLKIPSFIATLQARSWKNEESLAESYFKHTTRAYDKPQQVLTVLIGVMNRIINSPEADSKLTTYCATLVQQFSSDNSKSRFLKKYNKEQKEVEVKENEEEADTEARLTSRMLTTIEAKTHTNNVRKRLDALFEEGSSDDDEDGSVAAYDAASNTETEYDLESAEELNGELDNPFMEAVEFPSLQVAKEKNLYRFQAPSNHIISPNKPIIQLTDLSVLKTYFDICIGSSTKEASEETRLEYERLMAQQKEYFHLKSMPGGVYDALLQLLQSSQAEMFDKIVNLPKDNPFLEFVKFAMFDFLLNLKRPQHYNNNDERSIYCEVFVPLFKAFGNCTQSLTYSWCEKKAKDSDYVWLVSNDFTKDRRNNLKLLDGVGRLVMSDILNYLLMESSGFNNDKALSHSLNDTLKNIKNGHDNLKFFVSNYRNASLDTMKKIHLFSCQIIQNKITLIKYSIKSPTTWRAVECRSASVPLSFSDTLEYIKVFELFAFLHNDIREQYEVFQQLKRENLNIVPVNDQNTVAHTLL